MKQTPKHTYLAQRQGRVINTPAEVPASVTALAAMGMDLISKRPDKTTLGKALEALGSGLGCSRAILVHAVRRDDETEMEVVGRWIDEDCALPSVHETRLFQPTMEAFGLQRWRDLLSNGIRVQSVVLDGDDAESRYMQTRSVRSYILEPLIIEGLWWGFLEIDQCDEHRQWDDADLAALSVTRSMLSLSLHNEALRDEMEHNAAELYEARVHSVSKSGELDEITRWKNTVFSSFAHEFRTPLYTLLGFSATLIENEELNNDEEIRRMCLQHIFEQSRRLENLVKEVLYVSDLQRPADASRWETVDTRELVTATAEEFRAKAEGDGVAFYLELPDNDSHLTCQPEQVQRILENLLRYALGSTHAGNWISLRVTGDDRAVFLSISDNGVGISSEHITRIFEPFYGAGKAQSSGLGLSIVKDIVDLHHGFITVESRENEGTVFNVTLPRVPVVQ